MTRRELLGGTGVLATWPGMGCRRSTKKAAGMSKAAPAAEAFDPTAALSLHGLAAALRNQRGAAFEKWARLSGLNRLIGVSVEDDGDVLLLGHKETSWPDLHIDDLAIALRSAFRAGLEYNEPPGCSIDPREGTEDPWRMQKVRVFGMPFSCAMAARLVAIDYELKKASLGLIVLKPGLPTLVEPVSDPISACADTKRTEREVQKAHRFWFCPLTADSSRFVQEERAIWIEKPIGAQVLTEEEFLDRNARRTGSKPAEGAALLFVRAVSSLLAEAALPQYAALRGDFRLIEAAKLVALLGTPAGALGYFLSEHVIRQEKVPAFVGGLWRDESGEITCENTITEKAMTGGTSYESHTALRKYRQRVRGGVEAQIRIASHDMRKSNGELGNVLRRVREAKPSKDAAVWTLPQ